MNDLSPPIQLLPLGLTDWKFVGGGEAGGRSRGVSGTMRSHFTLNLPYYYDDIHIYLSTVPRII